MLLRAITKQIDSMNEWIIYLFFISERVNSIVYGYTAFDAVVAIGD